MIWLAIIAAACVALSVGNMLILVILSRRLRQVMRLRNALLHLCVDAWVAGPWATRALRPFMTITTDDGRPYR
jgi:hypothetical protein